MNKYEKLNEYHLNSLKIEKSFIDFVEHSKLNFKYNMSAYENKCYEKSKEEMKLYEKRYINNIDKLMKSRNENENKLYIDLNSNFNYEYIQFIRNMETLKFNVLNEKNDNLYISAFGSIVLNIQTNNVINYSSNCDDKVNDLINRELKMIKNKYLNVDLEFIICANLEFDLVGDLNIFNSTFTFI